MKEKTFEALKEEILKRAKEASACKPEYGKAYASENYEQLMEVLRNNFQWACANGVLDAEIIKEYQKEFAEGKIFLNVDVIEGFLLASGNATVRASDNATVRASGNATVRASDNATVRAWDNATVEASVNATVEASDNATVRASGNATVRASDNATVEAWGNATVEASDNATVRAWGNAYITSYTTIECKLSEHAIYKIRKSNIIRYVDENMKFEKE